MLQHHSFCGHKSPPLSPPSTLHRSFLPLPPTYPFILAGYYDLQFAVSHILYYPSLPLERLYVTMRPPIFPHTLLSMLLVFVTVVAAVPTESSRKLILRAAEETNVNRDEQAQANALGHACVRNYKAQVSMSSCRHLNFLPLQPLKNIVIANCCSKQLTYLEIRANELKSNPNEPLLSGNYAGAKSVEVKRLIDCLETIVMYLGYDPKLADEIEADIVAQVTKDYAKCVTEVSS